MAYRELSMIDVAEVLRRWQAGHSERRIGRDTGLDRKTVSRYCHWAARLKVPRDRPLTENDIQEVAQCVQSRRLPDPSEERQEVARQRGRIEQWLEQSPPLRLTKIYTLLKRDGLLASYWTLRRFVIDELGWHKKEPTILLEDPPPAQEVQVDFGQMGWVTDAETGKRLKLWALIITFSFSRHMFVWPTLLQTTEALCEGLDRAWAFFGGMPLTLIPDNPKAIVADPDALNTRLSEAFSDYVQDRGLFVDPARIRSPKDKPRVENQVPYVRENWFAGETFANLEDARESARHWCLEVAGRRIHGTTRKVPLDVFAELEKPALRPPPDAPFDVPLWTEAKVHPDHHVQVARALYSVPTMYLGKKVRVRADKKLVKIYFKTELIKVHERRPPGGRSTDVNDYPKGKAMYALRSIERVIAEAKGKGQHVGTYAERILAGPLPWQRMRQAYALLRLCETYGAGRVEAVCQSALAFDMIDVQRIRRMLVKASKPVASMSSEGNVVRQLTLPRFAREPEHFQTRHSTSDKEGA
jgi:transposase